MTKALFKLFILFITCSTVISCSEQDSPELPDNPGNTNQGKRLLLIAMSMIVTKCILVGSHALLAPPLLTKMQEEMRTLQKIFHYLQHTDLEKKLFLVLTTVEDI